MARIPVPLGPQSDSSRSKQGGGARLTNCYIEATQGGKTTYTINTRPRISLFSFLANGAQCRGHLALGNNLYVVAGEQVYKVQSSGVSTGLGTVLGQNPVVMSSNTKAPFNQITITADTNRYYLENDVLTEITDPDLPTGVHSNCYLNGRTIYGLNDGLYYFSDENATQNINALNFAEAERSADGGVRVFTFGEDFWYFGTESREIIRFTGDAFPFAPLLGAGQGKGEGCSAKNSVVEINQSVVWVNDLGHVVVSTGGASQKISTHDIDRDIEAALNLGLGEKITGYSLVFEGHQVYFLRSPLWCWYYDFTTSFWFRCTDYLSDTFKGGFLVRAFNKNLILDATDGKIFTFDFEASTDESQPCIVEIITSPLNSFPDGYICDALNLDVQSGVGVSSGDAHVQDPQVILEVSRDGGMTYGGQQTRSAGRQGQWNKQIKFTRLGATNGAGMVFKISLPEPVEKAVFQASADIRKLKG